MERPKQVKTIPAILGEFFGGATIVVGGFFLTGITAEAMTNPQPAEPESVSYNTLTGDIISEKAEQAVEVSAAFVLGAVGVATVVAGGVMSDRALRDYAHRQEALNTVVNPVEPSGASFPYRGN